jgi:hypothetical protein
MRARFLIFFLGIGAACAKFGSAPDDSLLADAGPDAVTGPDAQSPTEGIAPDAAVVCGDDAGTCHAPDICCVRMTGDNTCEKTATVCNDPYSAAVACDDPADCIGGAICCALVPNGRNIANVTCQPACPQTKGSFVVCTATSLNCSGQCIALKDALGVIPTPDPGLFVCATK